MRTILLIGVVSGIAVTSSAQTTPKSGTMPWMDERPKVFAEASRDSGDINELTGVVFVFPDGSSVTANQATAANDTREYILSGNVRLKVSAPDTK